MSRIKILVSIVIIFAIFACSSEHDDPIQMSGEWSFFLTVTFGKPGQGQAQFTFENPYPISIQGRGSYNGPDGVNEISNYSGILSGWIEREQFTFSFIETEKKHFSIQFNGSRINDDRLAGVFDAFLLEQAWFHGTFIAERSNGDNETFSNPDTLQLPDYTVQYSHISMPLRDKDYRILKDTTPKMTNSDIVHVFEDFENISDCSGISSSSFSYQDSFSGELKYPDQSVINFSMDQHKSDWTEYSRLDFWTWLEKETIDLSMRLSIEIPNNGNSEERIISSVLVPLTAPNQWQRHVIYLSDFEPTLPVSSFSEIIMFQIEILSQNAAIRSRSIYFDQFRIIDDRWFFTILLENGLMMDNYNAVAALRSDYQNGFYGQVTRHINIYYREERQFPVFDNPWTGFNAPQNNCFAEYQYPFPPYGCEFNEAIFRNQTDNYNINWLTWEEYGREEIDEPSTQYLFWQWNDRLNRHYLLSQLAAGITFPNDTDYDGNDITDDDRYRWQLRFQELIADWLYDFPLPQSEINWGDEAFTVLADITAAIRTNHWFKFMELLKEDYQSLPEWLYLDCLKKIYLEGTLNSQTLLEQWNPGNHTALKAFSLYCTGLVFPEFSGGGFQWRDEAISAMKGFNFPDGSNKEACTHYHLLILDTLNHFFDLAETNDPHLTHGLVEELEDIKGSQRLMHEYLWNIANSALTYQNDEDLWPSKRLWVPAINDGVGTGEEITRFISRLREMNQGNLAPWKSLYLSDIGQAVFRIGNQGNDIYALFDSGKFGSSAHGHQDKLSFVLSAYGRTLLCDPGGWGGSNLNWDRTAMHNAVTVDDYGQIRPYIDDYSSADDSNSWSTSVSIDSITGIYDQGFGYFSDTTPVLKANVSHKRVLEFHKNTDRPYFKLDDMFDVQDSRGHMYKVYFHFSPEVAETRDDLIIAHHSLTSKNGKIDIEATSQNGRWYVEDRLITNSLEYGNVTPAAAAYYEVNSGLFTTEITFTLTPNP